MMNPLLFYIIWRRRKEEEEQQEYYNDGCEADEQDKGVANRWNPLWFLR